MHYNKLCVTSVLALTAAVTTANAWNITINDMQSPNSTGFHAPGIGKGGEDQETEPGTASGQNWDLEAFDLKGDMLKIYSGYNLLKGENPYGLGDLFIDVDGDAHWQPGADNHIKGVVSNASFMYDYVVHFNNRSGTTIGNGEYDVYKIQGDKSVMFKETVFKSGSNPWVMMPERSQKLNKVASGIMSVMADNRSTITLDDGSKVTGGTRTRPQFIGDVDLGFLADGELNRSTLFHLTMECGNDSMVGRVPDAGSAVSLMGAAMAGLSFITRANRRKQ